MKARLAAAWQRQVQRIDALSLRERAIIFLAALAALAALADGAWVSPLWQRYKTTREALVNDSREVAALRMQVRQRLGPDAAGALPRDAADPAAALRRDVADLAATRTALQAEVQALSADADEMQRLPQVLERLLRQREGLTLVRVATLPPDDSDRKAGLARRGVELALAGRYGDLVDDLAALEQALPRLRWGALHLATLPGDEGGAPRAELSVRVDLIGVQR